MASLSPVDLVVLFGEETPLELLETLRPDVLVKGADYSIDQVVGADIVQRLGRQRFAGRTSAGPQHDGHDQADDQPRPGVMRIRATIRARPFGGTALAFR